MTWRVSPGSAALGLVASALLAAACGSGGSNAAQETAGCNDAPMRAEPIDGALEIGEGGPTDFRPIIDGASEELVLGSQGGYMVTPVLRIDSAFFDGDGKCASLDVIHTVGALAPASYHFKLPPQPAGEAYWYIGSLPLFLSYQTTGLVGEACSLAATFAAHGKTASAEVHTLLVDND